MYIVETVEERIEKANLQRRRDGEAKRKVRIFNDKLRIIGVDKQALDMQVEEKKKLKEAEEEKQKAHDAETLHNSKVVCILQHKEEKNKRAMHMDMVNFRQQHQQPQIQQFGLNDMDPSVIPGLMPPVLVGEDPDLKNRLQRQKEQFRDWSHQQQSEQAVERNLQMLEKLRYDQIRVEMDNRALQLQTLEKERRREEAVATKEFNLVKIQEKRRQQICDEDNKGLDINTALGRWGVPGLCPGYDLRGPTETLEQVLKFQRTQIEEKKRIELENKREEEQYDRVRLASARSALLLERKQLKLSRQLRRHVESSNSQLAEIQRQQQTDMETGSDLETFFKFNTCSR